MIFLYSKLDIQNKGEGLGNLQDFVEEPIVTWNASGYLEVEFKYFLYGDLAEYMIPDAKLKTRIHSNDEVYHLFTIYEVEPDYIENTIQVRAEMTLLHELKDRVVPAGTMRGTANEMIMFVKNRMDRDYPFVITGTTDKIVFIEHDNISAYELIFGEDGILKRTGAEIEFTDRGIRVSNRIGTIHRDELRESDFVTNLTVNELQGEDFVTRIIPFTTVMFDRPVRDGDRYTRETIETPTYGTPVISPNMTNKLYKVRTKFVEYRNEPTGVTKYYNYRTERGTETLEMNEYIYEDVTALNQDASTFFEDNIGIDEPTTTISIETLGLAKGYYTYLRYLNRYDIVTIYVEPKPYLTNTSETYVVQVNETVYEPLSDNLVSIGFTNDSITLRDAYRNVNEGRISDQQLQVELQKERLRDLEDRLVNYVYNHDGFRLEFGNVLPPPDEYREGDLYYLETGEGIDIYKLVNGAWEFLVGQSTREIIEGKIAEVEQQAEDLTKAIELSDQKADEAKEEAGLAKSAVDAFGIITQETADKMVTVEQIVADAESNASEALSQAGQAITDAQTAMGNAQSALSKASDVESTVSTLSKEVDTVAGKVTLKAEQTEVDTISGTVSTHTTTLSQHATAISSKAEQEEVDTVKGTVSTHTSTLEQHATDISARLTESQVNTLVSGKGYATQTWSNQTFATPQSVSTQLQSYAKTTDLNGMVTETTLATKNFITAGSVNTLLTGYAKTGDVPTVTQFNSLKNRYDSMEQVIGTDQDSVARAVMTSNLWETEVVSEITGLSSTVSQLSDSWALTLKSGDDIKTQLNASTNGVRIKGSLIYLDGNTTMNNAFARSLVVDKLYVADVTAFTAKFSKVIANNIDVNEISGNAMNFISGAFVSNAGSLLLSGSGIRVNFDNGYSLRINGSGTNYYTSGGLVIGGLRTAVPSSGTSHTLSLIARKGYTVSMDYQGSLAYNQSNRALSVDGTSGNITIHRPIYESTTSVGLSFLRNQMGNVGWGLLLTSTRATGSGIFLADNGQVWIGVSGGYKQFT